jgi:hypothetical protein
MIHELDNGEELLSPMDGTPLTEDQRYGFYVGLKQWQDTQYQRDRKNEYPPISDYIDGVVKGNQIQIDEYIQKCLDIKAKYPKPTE